MFKYPRNGPAESKLLNEHYLQTEDNEFVIKEVIHGEHWNEYTAVLNVEALEEQTFTYGFTSEEQTIDACLMFAFEGTGWTVDMCSPIKKRRTIDFEDTATAWDVLQSCLTTYRVECEIDALNKVVHIFEENGKDKGCYFIEGLNLRKISLDEDTYNLYTRIIPIGKDGMEISWLNGQNYIDNNTYSPKIKTYVWKDERYTNTTSLLEDGQAKLEDMAKPCEAYTADVINLARNSSIYSDILDYKIGDTVWLISKKTKLRKKQRIVKAVKYPEHPENNTVELSNKTKTFAEVTKEAEDITKEEAVSIANKAMKKYLSSKYYEKAEVESHITASLEEISLGVSQTYATKTQLTKNIDGIYKELGEYATTQELKSAIELSAKDISLSVSQTYATKTTLSETVDDMLFEMDTAASAAEKGANKSTDEKLKNYSTTTQMNAAIKLATTEISSEVSKKVNETELGTKITQNAENVRIAWNQCSKYIQFENARLTIYNGAFSTAKKRAVFDENGNHFWRDGYYVGKIGTNEYVKNTAHKGLVFDLDLQGKYMAFAQKKVSGGDYMTMLCFSRENSIYTQYGIHAGCDLYMHNYNIENVRLSGETAAKYNGNWYKGFNGAIRIITDITDANGGHRYTSLRVANGIIVGYWAD